LETPPRPPRIPGAVDALPETTDAALEGTERENYDKVKAALRQGMGEEAYSTARDEGRSVTRQQVVELT